MASKFYTEQELAEATRKIGIARTKIVMRYPYFATILMQTPFYTMECPAEEAPGSAGTDGSSIIFHPHFFAKYPVEEIGFILAHEATHVGLLHVFRKGGRDPERWNVACDWWVNFVLEQNGIKTLFPGDTYKCPFDPSPYSVEELYEKVKTPKGQGQGKGQGNQSQRQGGPGQDLRQPSGSRDSQKAKEQQAKVLQAQAKHAAQMAGKNPAGFSREWEELDSSKLPWQDLLEPFLLQHMAIDYDWNKMSRRYLQYDVGLPSLHSEAYDKIWIACDTSGSIDQEQLRAICSEALGCLRATSEKGQPELQMIWFDTRPYPQVVTEVRDLKPQGGGGTDFACVFEWIERSKEKPPALIFITDGYCDSYGPEPDFPVLWVLVQAGRRDFSPPFGVVAWCMDEK